MVDISDISGTGFYGKGYWGRKVYWYNIPSRWRTIDAENGGLLEKMMKAWGDFSETFVDQIIALPNQRNPYLVRTESTNPEWFYVTEVMRWEDDERGKVTRLIGEKKYENMPATDEDNPPSEDQDVLEQRYQWFPYQPIHKIGRWWQTIIENSKYEVVNVRSRNFDPPLLYNDETSLANEVWVSGGDMDLAFDYSDVWQEVGIGDGSQRPAVLLPVNNVNLRRNSSIVGDTQYTANSSFAMKIDVKDIETGIQLHRTVYDGATDEFSGNVYDRLLLWESCLAVPDRIWRDIEWSPGIEIFCAVGIAFGSPNGVIISRDGLVWDEIVLPVSGMNWGSAVWVDNLKKICVLAESAGAGECRAMFSTDGIIWTLSGIVPSGETENWGSMAWSPSLGILCSISNGTAESITSPDGITWTKHDIGPLVLYNSDIAWSPALEIFCAVGNANVGISAMISRDGINWEEVSALSSSEDSKVAWSPKLEIFCTIGYDDSTGSRIAISDDGTIWQKIDTSYMDISWRSILWSEEEEIFVIATDSGTGAIMKSIDGIHWKNMVNIDGSYFFSMAWSPSLNKFCTLSIDAPSYVAGITTSNFDTLDTSVSYGSVEYMTGKVAIDLSDAGCYSVLGAEIHSKFIIDGYFIKFYEPPMIDYLAADYGYKNDKNDPEDVQRSTIANLTKFMGKKATSDSYVIRGKISLFSVLPLPLFKICNEELFLRFAEISRYSINGKNYVSADPSFLRYNAIRADESFYDHNDGGTPSWVTLVDNILLGADDSRWDGMTIAQAYSLDVTQGMWAPVSPFNSTLRGPAVVSSIVELTVDEAESKNLSAGFAISIEMERCQYEAFNYQHGKFAISSYEHGVNSPSLIDVYHIIDEVSSEWIMESLGATDEEDIGTWTVVIGTAVGAPSPIELGDDIAVRYLPGIQNDNCCTCRAKNIVMNIEATEEAYEYYTTDDLVEDAIDRLKNKLLELRPVQVSVIEWDILRRKQEVVYGVQNGATAQRSIDGATLSAASKAWLTVEHRGDLSDISKSTSFTVQDPALAVIWEEASQFTGHSDADTWYTVVEDVELNISDIENGITMKAESSSLSTFGDVRWTVRYLKKEF